MTGDNHAQDTNQEQSLPVSPTLALSLSETIANSAGQATATNTVLRSAINNASDSIEATDAKTRAGTLSTDSDRGATRATPPEVAQAFLERRVKPQQDWFSRQANRSKRLHQISIGVQAISMASIPVLNMLTVASKNTNYTYLSTIAAAVSGLIAVYSGQSKFRENWLRYRQTATHLESIQLDYELKLPPYDGPDAQGLMITTVRKILDEEHKSWLTDVKSAASIKVSSSDRQQGLAIGAADHDDDDGS